MINSFFILKALLVLNLFRMGVFWGAHGLDGGGGKTVPLPKICHISCNDGTWHTKILPKEDPKVI